MADLTKCPHCGFPLVVPNPPKCGSCGGELVAGSRESTAAPEPRDPPVEPLFSLVMQSEEIKAALERAVAAHDFSGLEVISSPKLVRDSDLGIPAGTLTDTMPGQPADAPKMVLLVTVGARPRPSEPRQVIERFRRLTAIGRTLAESPATRALILYAANRVLLPEDFLDATQKPDVAPDMQLFVWTNLLRDGDTLRTIGMKAFGLPDVSVVESTCDSYPEAALLLRAATYTMLIRGGPLEEGEIVPGPPPQGMPFYCSVGEGEIHLAPERKQSSWRRMPN